MEKNYRRVTYACYIANASMAVCTTLPSLLFIAFREMYGISYSLLGALAFVFYGTQLVIDLMFSFFSHKFNISLTVKSTLAISAFGLVAFALLPMVFPQYAYIGLLIGTVVFACSAGLCEVLISPVIDAIPSDNPERSMTTLHSTYAWGSVACIILSTVFLRVFGVEHWQLLTLLLAIVPVFGAVLFGISDIPVISTPEKALASLGLLKNPGVMLCVFAIFCGGAAECAMTKWASGFLESALGISKMLGDIFGVAMFSVMLGLGRSLYAKIGKHLEKVLLFGAIGATVCYLAAAVSPYPAVGLIACALTGFCTSMLWPGTLIVASDRHPSGGVFIFAIMAAGGDFGASFAPQLMGIVADAVIAGERTSELAVKLGLTPEQFGMKCSMLAGMLFPLIGIFLFLHIFRTRNKHKEQPLRLKD